MAKRPKLLAPETMRRVDVEQELEQMKGNDEIPALRRKLALYRRLKELPKVPPKAQRDPDCAYPA